MQKVDVQSVGAVRSKEGFVTLALGEEPGGIGRHLFVSRLVQQNGSALPGEDYSLSSGTGATVYGGLVHQAREGSNVRMLLSPEAVRVLGLEPEVEWQLPGPAQARLVTIALQWLTDPRGPAPSHVFTSPDRA